MVKGEKMKILVFDDKEINRQAAIAQLGKDHDLTVVGTYNEAKESLRPEIDRKKMYEFLEQGKSYAEAVKMSSGEARFHAVLTDLLVPASDRAQGNEGKKFVGQEMPLGLFIALLAAKYGVKIVGLLTDANHHNHPSSACINPFNTQGELPYPLAVEGAKVFLSNNRSWVGEFDPNDLSKQLSYEEQEGKVGTITAKNWSAFLNYIVTSSDD